MLLSQSYYIPNSFWDTYIMFLVPPHAKSCVTYNCDTNQKGRWEPCCENMIKIWCMS